MADQELLSDKNVITTMKASAKLALQLGRLVPNATLEEKMTLSSAIGLCNASISVAMVDTQLARTLYSQARRLASVKSVRKPNV